MCIRDRYYGQRLLFEAMVALAVVTGTSAVIGLASGCVLMVRETQIAVKNLSAEARLLMAAGAAPEL